MEDDLKEMEDNQDIVHKSGKGVTKCEICNSESYCHFFADILDFNINL